MCFVCLFVCLFVASCATKAHNDLLRTYESKLTSYGIPPQDLGFKPLETEVSGQVLGQGPAGLVSTFN